MAVTVPEGLLPLNGLGETVLVDGAEIANVLVSPGDAQDSDLSDDELPAGAVVRYRLDFPKAFAGDLEGSSVEVRGEDLRIVGHPVRYMDALTPGDWNMPAYAVAMSGDYSATIRIVALVAAVDDLGDPVVSEQVVYEGPAQARNHSGSEGAGSVEEQRARETWWFVVPWQESFSALRPQSTSISYGGADYDVARIVNVDERSETASFEAVRHG